MFGFLFRGLIKDFERVVKNVQQDVRAEVEHLFDDKLFPLADKVDYTIKNRVAESILEAEKLETKVKDDIEGLLNNTDTKVKENIERIN